MKIRTKTMFGTHHSWSVTFRNLFNQFIKLGHEPYIISTNGYSLCPDDWKNFYNKEIDNPDIDICYTLPRNFKDRYQKNSKLKLAIYNYETDIMPIQWLKEIDQLDYILPSSNFSKEIFIKNGWNENKCIVIPHGINLSEFENKEKFALTTDKKFKFLNISIPHYRKNIDLLVDAYYSAFNSNDDVCLVIKTDLNAPKGRVRFKFEADVKNQILEIQKKHGSVKTLPQIEIVQLKLESIVPLYNSCNSLVSTSSTEGFGLPMLEALASNLVVIAPRATGQLDFLNDKNSILVNVKEINATEKYQYWKASDGAKTFLPIKDDVSESMIKVYKNYNEIKNNFSCEIKNTTQNFTWEAAAKKILAIKK